MCPSKSTIIPSYFNHNADIIMCVHNGHDGSEAILLDFRI